MFFAGEALYAGLDIGTVGQRPRDGAAITTESPPTPPRVR
jgi:hypothetical protein